MVKAVEIIDNPLTSIRSIVCKNCIIRERSKVTVILFLTKSFIDDEFRIGLRMVADNNSCETQFVYHKIGVMTLTDLLRYPQLIFSLSLEDFRQITKDDTYYYAQILNYYLEIEFIIEDSRRIGFHVTDPLGIFGGFRYDDILDGRGRELLSYIQMVKSAETGKL